MLLKRIFPASKDDDVHQIVKMSATLALLFGTQKARFEVHLPSKNDKLASLGYDFKPCNEDTDEKSVDRSQDMSIIFGVRPGLRRWGNARGAALETVTQLSPASVYVQPS